MSTVHQRALQSVKSFRAAQIARRPAHTPPDLKPTTADGTPRANPFLVSRVLRHTPATRLAAGRLSTLTDEQRAKHKAGLTYHTRGAQVSLRRQADLAKKARLTNTLHLLPPGPKAAALQLRMQRVRASLAPVLVGVLDAVHVPADPAVALAERLRELKLSSRRPLEADTKALAALRARAEDLKDAITEFEITSLVDAKKESLELQTYHRQKEQLEELKVQIGRQAARVNATKKGITRLEGVLQKKKEKKAAPPTPGWQQPIEWLGKVPERKTAGEELGIRLYAGRKKMFKGHLWERKREGSVRKRAVLMRDMAARIQRYKEYYKKRKPNPLKPSRYSKPPKLPY